MQIIKATTEHICSIAKIENVCFSHPWSEESIKESLSNPNSRFYVAIIDGVVAGYMGLQIFSGEGYVTNVATLPKYRKKGVAKALISEALKNEMDFISLEVRESNYSAISLYEKFDFLNVGVRPNFYRDPDENAIIMTKTF